MTPRNHALQIVRDAGPAVPIGSSAAIFLCVPPSERLGGADAEAGNDEDNPCSGDVVKPRQPIATRPPTRGAALEKVRHVGADGPGKTAQPRTSLLPPPSPPCMGMRFAMVTTTSLGAPVRRAALHNNSAARQTRFRESDGQSGSSQTMRKGPGTGVKVSASASAIDWNVVRSS